MSPGSFIGPYNKKNKAPVPIVVRKEKIIVVNENNQKVIIEKKKALSKETGSHPGGIRVSKPLKKIQT